MPVQQSVPTSTLLTWARFVIYVVNQSLIVSRQAELNPQSV